MTHAIPRGAQPWLAAVSEHLKAFEEDHSMGFGLPILATDLRELAAAATRAADVLMETYTAALIARNKETDHG